MATSTGPQSESRADTIPKQNRVVISFRGEWDMDIDIPGIDGIKREIVAPYPEEGIDITLSSNWENDFQNVAETVGAESFTQKALGGRSIQGAMSRLFGKSNLYTWKGIDPVEISMNLKFVNHSDPLYDVIQPAFQLGATQMPNAGGQSEEGGVFVRRPVEVSEGSAENNIVAVNIGTWLSFPAVLPTNASTSFSGTLSTSPSNLTKSFPFQAEVDFQFIGSVFPQKGDFGFNVNSDVELEEVDSINISENDIDARA